MECWRTERQSRFDGSWWSNSYEIVDQYRVCEDGSKQTAGDLTTEIIAELAGSSPVPVRSCSASHEVQNRLGVDGCYSSTFLSGSQNLHPQQRLAALRCPAELTATSNFSSRCTPLLLDPSISTEAPPAPSGPRGGER